MLGNIEKSERSSPLSLRSSEVSKRWTVPEVSDEKYSAHSSAEAHNIFLGQHRKLGTKQII
jgi:hypothetical protein